MSSLRVGIAHASPSATEVLRRVVTESQGLELVWTARHANECRARSNEAPVDLLLLHVDLPGERASAWMTTDSRVP